MFGPKIQLHPASEVVDRRSTVRPGTDAVHPGAGAGGARQDGQPAARPFADQLGDQVRRTGGREAGRQGTEMTDNRVQPRGGNALPERKPDSAAPVPDAPPRLHLATANTNAGAVLPRVGEGEALDQLAEKAALPDAELLLLALEQAGEADQSLQDWLEGELGEVPDQLSRSDLIRALLGEDTAMDADALAAADLLAEGGEPLPARLAEPLLKSEGETEAQIPEPDAALPAEDVSELAELQGMLEALQADIESLLDTPAETLRSALEGGELPVPDRLNALLEQLETLASRLEVPAERLFSQLSGLEAKPLDDVLSELLEQALSGDSLVGDQGALQVLATALDDWLAGMQGGMDSLAEGEPVTPPTLFERAIQAMQTDLQSGDGEEEKKSTPLRQEGQERQRDRALLEALVSRSEREASRLGGNDDSGPLRMASDNPGARPDQRGAVSEQIRAHIEREMPVRYSTGEAARQIGERLVMMIGQDIQEARIRLDPPDLGALDVRVTTQGEQVQVQIVAQQPMVRDLLEQQANRLREQLEQQGFTEVEVDIGDPEASEEQLADESDTEGSEDSTEGDNSLTGQERVERPLGLVDQYV